MAKRTTEGHPYGVWVEDGIDNPSPFVTERKKKPSHLLSQELSQRESQESSVEIIGKYIGSEEVR